LTEWRCKRKSIEAPAHRADRVLTVRDRTVKGARYDSVGRKNRMMMRGSVPQLRNSSVPRERHNRCQMPQVELAAAVRLKRRLLRWLCRYDEGQSGVRDGPSGVREQDELPLDRQQEMTVAKGLERALGGRCDGSGR
jgi:hypothetical protein